MRLLERGTICNYNSDGEGRANNEYELQTALRVVAVLQQHTFKTDKQPAAKQQHSDTAVGKKWFVTLVVVVVVATPTSDDCGAVLDAYVVR